MTAVYTLAMLWWEIRVLVSTCIVGYLCRDIVEQFHRRLFEVYCTLYTAPCTIETDQVQLNIFGGALVIRECCLCLPDDELLNSGFKTRVVARAGKISMTCHPVRYLLAYLGTDGDLCCFRSILFEDVDCVIEKRTVGSVDESANETDHLDVPNRGTNDASGRTVLASTGSPSVSVAPVAESDIPQNIPPVNFSCQLMGRTLAAVRLRIPDYDTGPERGLVNPVPTHLIMPQSRCYVPMPKRHIGASVSVGESSVCAGAEADQTQVQLSSARAESQMKASFETDDSVRNKTNMDSALMPQPSSNNKFDELRTLPSSQTIKSTYNRIRENTYRLYDQAVQSREMVSSALHDLYQSTKASVDTTIRSELDAFHYRMRGDALLRRHDVRIQAECFRVVRVTVRLVNMLPPRLKHLEQKVLQVDELLLTEIGYPEAVYRQAVHRQSDSDSTGNCENSSCTATTTSSSSHKNCGPPCSTDYCMNNNANAALLNNLSDSEALSAAPNDSTPVKPSAEKRCQFIFHDAVLPSSPAVSPAPSVLTNCNPANGNSIAEAEYSTPAHNNPPSGSRNENKGTSNNPPSGSRNDNKGTSNNPQFPALNDKTLIQTQTQTPLSQLLGGTTTGRQMFEVPRGCKPAGATTRSNYRSSGCIPIHARVATTATTPLSNPITPMKPKAIVGSLPDMQRGLVASTIIHKSEEDVSSDSSAYSSSEGHNSANVENSSSSDSSGVDDDDSTWSSVSDAHALQLMEVVGLSNSKALRFTADGVSGRELAPCVKFRQRSSRARRTRTGSRLRLSRKKTQTQTPPPTAAEWMVGQRLGLSFAKVDTAASTGPPTSVLMDVLASSHYSTTHILFEKPWDLLGVPFPLLQWEFEKLLLFYSFRSNAGGLLRHSLAHIWHHGVRNRVKGGAREIGGIVSRLFYGSNAIPAPSPIQRRQRSETDALTEISGISAIAAVVDSSDSESSDTEYSYEPEYGSDIGCDVDFNIDGSTVNDSVSRQSAGGTDAEVYHPLFDFQDFDMADWG